MKSNWRDFVVQGNQSLMSAMNIINELGSQIVTVVSEGKLVGTLSDGDIRRALLKNQDFNMSVAEAMNTKPKYVEASISDYEAEQIMTTLGINVLPIVDSNLMLLGMMHRKNRTQIQQSNTPVLILAGGRGERLLPLTANIPKPLIEVAGDSILEILLRRLSTQGFNEIHIAVHHMSEKIISALGDGKQFGLNITYILETIPLGTVGAVNEIKDVDEATPILVINADVLLSVDFGTILDFHNSGAFAATAGIVETEIELPFGIAELKNNLLVSITEKPTIKKLISCGVNVVTKSNLRNFSTKSKIDLTAVLEELILSNQKVGAFLIEGYWTDIGNLKSLSEARSKFSTLLKNDF